MPKLLCDCGYRFNLSIDTEHEFSLIPEKDITDLILESGKKPLTWDEIEPFLDQNRKFVLVCPSCRRILVKEEDGSFTPHAPSRYTERPEPEKLQPLSSMMPTLGLKIRRDVHELTDGRRLIRLEVLGMGYPNSELNRNVFLVDAKGTEIWRIADHECVDGGDPFVGIQIAPDGKVTGTTWSGWRFEINLANGELKKLGWTKN